MNKEQELQHLREEHIKDIKSLEAMSEEIESLREQLQQQKLNDLQAKKQEIEKEIDNENYRIFMNTPRKPIEKEQKEEPKASKSLDEILMED